MGPFSQDYSKILKVSELYGAHLTEWLRCEFFSSVSVSLRSFHLSNVSERPYFFKKFSASNYSIAYAAQLLTTKCTASSTPHLQVVWSWNLHQLKEHPLLIQMVLISISCHKQSLSGALHNRGIIWQIIDHWYDFACGSCTWIIDLWDDLRIILPSVQQVKYTSVYSWSHCVLSLDDAWVWLIMLITFFLASGCRAREK